MVRVNLSFVPPGGGETDYSLPMDLPALPRAGDYISVNRTKKIDKPDHQGSEDFIVRRVWWSCEYPEDGTGYYEAGKAPVGTGEIWVECEFAIGPYSSEAHKRGAGTAKARAPVQSFDDSMY